ncbi:MAG: DUF2384 domain-containing protein [Magnetococcales bacterium]|nr:DUF2384 domain-containing protein [Magnetococcales bacterium]
MSVAVAIPSKKPSKTIAQAGLSAFMKIMEEWRLTSDEARVLLGRPANSTFYNWKKKQPATLPHDTLTRISYILGIYKNLRILYRDPGLGNRWINQPNTRLNGQSPRERLLAGEITDLAFIRQWLDATRGGWS